ncbi:cell division protein cdc48 [Cystoisospora suis]|uniref:Cell division protein cdc48 n=1 Tax=Cystoisospora suis TaxID=483139 RepID=A0A2C6KIN3_9APIC|nr:cell division protein cdc48 [Cystoisospora suis]
MDALRGHQVIVLATCTHLDCLDGNLRRSGRFDTEIRLPLPGASERRDILQALLLRSPSLRISSCVDIDVLADRCVGYVAADLHSLVKESIYHALTRRVYIPNSMKHATPSSSSTEVLSLEERRRRSPKESRLCQDTEREKGMELSEEDLDAVASSHRGEQQGSSPSARVAKKREKEEDRKALAIVKQEKEAKERWKTSSSHFTPFSSFDLLLSHIQRGNNSWSVHTPPQTLGMVDERKDEDAMEVEEEEKNNYGVNAPETSGDCKKDRKLQTLEEERSTEKQTSISSSSIRRPSLSLSFSLVKEDFEHALRTFMPTYKKTGSFLPRPNIRWEEVGGLVHAKKEIEERILFPLNFPDFYEGLGPELLSKFVGDSEASLRRLFSRASFFSPSLIFFDEIDALCGSRGLKGDSSHNKVEERMIAQLLTELDGMNDRGKVYLVAATNRPDMIDPALLRPGRLEVRVYVHLPDHNERAEILRKGWKRLRREQKEEREKHRLEQEDENPRELSDLDLNKTQKKKRKEEDKSEDAKEEEEEEESEGEENPLDFDMIASMTERFSGADLDALLRESTLLMIQEEREAFLSAWREGRCGAIQRFKKNGELEVAGEKKREETEDNERQKEDKHSRPEIPQLVASVFYGGRRRRCMHVKQKHLIEAAKRISPSVTAEQVEFYEDYRAKLVEGKEK